MITNDTVIDFKLRRLYNKLIVSIIIGEGGRTRWEKELSSPVITPT